MNTQKRLGLIRKLMEANRLSSVILSLKEDIFYYSGHKASEGNLLLVNNSGKPILFVSPLENDAEKARAEVVYLTKIDQLTKHIKGGLVGYDEHNLSANRFLLLHKHHIHLKKFSVLIKKPREVKYPEEIENIRHAIKISENVLKGLKFYGKTEIEVSNKIEADFKLSGASSAFDPIVANGTGSIHHPPENRRILRKNPTIIDFGARVNWYCSDITRSYPGTEKKWKVVWENVSSIQKEIIDFVRPGVTMEDIKKLYEKLMAKNKYKIYHSFGHGLGLEVHEQITGPLKEGMVITVEPGVYIKHLGGIRIEDTILVRKGKAEVMSKNVK